jgi:RimJ/RimL family protein N-acetyltransferase
VATFTIDDAADGDLLGTITVRFYREANAEVTYSVLPHARRRRVATRAVRLVAPWAFDGRGVRRLELRAHPQNVASQGVAEQAGFTREGIERRSRELHGRRHDCVLFSLLPDDLGLS